jgi:predicted AAA+ superfamily ATPase
VRNLPEVTESLAGRVTNVHLRPFTVGELLEKSPAFFQKAFTREWPMQITGYDREAIITLAFRGGYPEVIRLSEDDRESWHRDYIGNLLGRDLKDIANIRRHDTMEDLLFTLAAWSGKLMDKSSISSKLAVSRATLDII